MGMGPVPRHPLERTILTLSMGFAARSDSSCLSPALLAPHPSGHNVGRAFVVYEVQLLSPGNAL